MSNKPKKVLVTGFGPFGEHTVNASWVSVQKLAELEIEGVDLVIEEIPVNYKIVQQCVPLWWNSHKPDLCIHVGVSGIASKLTLEHSAHNNGYSRIDVCMSCPENNCCIEGADECKYCVLNLDEIHEYLISNDCPCKVEISNDAGRYLCDFIYYTSLHYGDNPSLFVHVPPLDQPYSDTELAVGLQMVIQAALEQLVPS